MAEPRKPGQPVQPESDKNEKKNDTTKGDGRDQTQDMKSEEGADEPTNGGVQTGR